MIKINKVTTKSGDTGQTLGPGLKMMPKNCIHIEFLGKLDELNVSIGNILLYQKDRKLRKILEEIQNQLFDIGSAFFKQDNSNIHELVKYLEDNIELYNSNLKELCSFLLPQGNNLVIALHQARCKTRDTERNFWKSLENNETNLKEIGIYLNRLSDFLFIIIRQKSRECKNICDDVEDHKLWIPGIQNRS